MPSVTTAHTRPRPEHGCDDPAAEIQHTLCALAEIEARFESIRKCLDGWAGAEATRKRLLDNVESRCAAERLPLTRRLAELHQGMTLALLFKRLYHLR